MKLHEPQFLLMTPLCLALGIFVSASLAAGINA